MDADERRSEARGDRDGRRTRGRAARGMTLAHPPTGITAMQSRALMTLRLSTAPTQDVGAGPHGTRVTFLITGGSFEGDRLRGKVLPGGDDWTIKRSDGVMELDLRITLETDDGALIHMTFEGLRDDGAPGAPYFRTAPLRDCRAEVRLLEPAACRRHGRDPRRRAGSRASKRSCDRPLSLRAHASIGCSPFSFRIAAVAVKPSVCLQASTENLLVLRSAANRSPSCRA